MRGPRNDLQDIYAVRAVLDDFPDPRAKNSQRSSIPQRKSPPPRPIRMSQDQCPAVAAWSRGYPASCPPLPVLASRTWSDHSPLLRHPPLHCAQKFSNPNFALLRPHLPTSASSRLPCRPIPIPVLI